MGLQSTVGRRGGQNSRNRIDDQRTVQALLNKIPIGSGGAGGALNERMVEGICSDKLYFAILNFQKKNLPNFVDGHVDPGGRTLVEIEKLAKAGDAAVAAAKAASAAAQKAASKQAAIDDAVDQMLGNKPGSEVWKVTGTDAPLSGSAIMAGTGVASVARIPVPGTGGLAIELSPRNFKGPSTSTIFIQDITGRKHLRLDYGPNVRTGNIDYHWNQNKMNPNAPGAKFPITNHTPVGTAGRVIYYGAKFVKWGGRVLLVVAIAQDVWSIVKASNPMRRTMQVLSGWALATDGCAVAGEYGAGFGTGIEPGLGTAVGGILGCLGGGAIGYFFGNRIAGTLYDWAEGTHFTPLPEAEEP